jgi:hypothetical protein
MLNEPMFSFETLRPAWLTCLVVPALLLAACAPGERAAAPAASAASDCSPLSLDRKAFPDIPKVDNKFLPLVPAMQFYLDGFVIRVDKSRHPHRIETTVTQLTKVIDGVNTIVIFERDFQDDKLAESELFFVAQDNQGTVWRLGEYPEEYDNGQLLGAPSAWLSGVARGRAGTEMVGKPRVGSSPFLQGLGPEVGFKDCGVVFKSGEHMCVRVGCYDGVLEVDEFAPLKPREGHQRKFYAPGVGNIKVAAAGGEDPEELDLTKAAKICAAELANLQGLALSQDGRGYQFSKDLYGKTLPAKETLRAQTCAG